MQTRIIPQGMQKQVLVETAKKKETARVENTREGMCPICHVKMVRSQANGIDVMYCADDSLVMPVRDQKSLFQQYST